MDSTWKKVLAPEFKKDYFNALIAFVEGERNQYTVYPPVGEVFRAFDLTPFDKVRVVILGQDPYHGPGQAHGLAFSVRPGTILPPSLVNIFKEAQADVGFKPPGHGCLEHWAKQGVLLLNTVLTVREKSPGSHRGHGWEQLTTAALRALLDLRKDPLVFVLWGSDARKKASLIDSDNHCVLESSHPSPLSAHQGFLGSKPFSAVNAALTYLAQEPIDWQLPPQ
jgi:uracil-DNA glycosylase